MSLRTIFHVGFRYKVPALDDGGKPLPGPDGGPLLVEKIAYKGETVDIPRPEDVALGEKHGAFETPKAKAAPAKTPDVPDPENLAERTVGELADWITAAEPGVRKLIALAGDNPELAGRLIEAENTATKGDPRKSLIEGLERVAKKGGDAT